MLSNSIAGKNARRFLSTTQKRIYLATANLTQTTNNNLVSKYIHINDKIHDIKMILMFNIIRNITR